MSKGPFYVLGLDPGFANCGYAVLALDGAECVFVAAGVIRTQKSDKKHKVLATDDNLRRAQRIVTLLHDLARTFPPAVICAEAMSFPRSSSAAAKMAMTWGIVATMSVRESLAVVQASPQEIKLAVCGSKSASKEEVEAQVLRRFPEMKALLDEVPDSLHEHAFDAAAAILTGLEGETLKTLTTLASR